MNVFNTTELLLRGSGRRRRLTSAEACFGACFCVWVFSSLLVVTGCDRPSAVQEELATKPTQSPPQSQPESQAAGLARIRRLISAGDASAAGKAVQSHLLRYSDDSNAMVLAAQLLNAQGQVHEAVAMLDAAAQHSSTDAAKWRRRAASMLFQAGVWQEAIDRLEALLVEQPELHIARHELVSMLNDRGFRFEANQHVRRLCQFGDATVDELRGLMYPSRSFNGLDEKPNVADVQRNRQLGELNVARAMWGEGDVRDATLVLQRGSLVDQRHPAAVALYGQLLIESQQFGAFGDWVGGVNQDVKRYPAYWLAVGGWAMRERQFDLAVSQFAEAILREPGDLAASDRLCQALSAGGHAEESERFRRRSVLIDRLMILTRELFAGGQWDPAAVDEISRLLTESGRPLEALGWYRIALAKMGSPKAAIEKLDQALAMADDLEFQRRNRATLLCDLDMTRFPGQIDLADIPGTDVASQAMPLSQAAFPAAEPVFVNVASKVGLEFVYFNAEQQVRKEFRLIEQLGTGVACLDYDLDGRVDFYVGQGSSDPPGGRGTRSNLLARSLGDRFSTVTELAKADDRGYTYGVTAGDWNQDGFPDLVVGNLLRNTLLINQGDGTFVAQRGDRIWDLPLNTTSLAMADVNGDHLPDIIEVNYVDDARVYEPINRSGDGSPVRLPAPLDFRPATDRLFLSRGDGGMAGRNLAGRDVGGGEPDPEPHDVAATGLGLVVTNLVDGPGNEIFVANDRLANHFWEQRSVGDRRESERTRSDAWQDTAAARGVAFGAQGTPQGCMGIAVSDFDHNGCMDLHVTNFENEWNNQFMQDESGFYRDLVVAFGLDQPTYRLLGFGVQAIDYDNNAETDLIIGNGNVEDYSEAGRPFQMPTILLAMENKRFVAKTVGGDPAYWEAGHLSRALARCDWNNDGKTDVVITDLIEPLVLLENRTESDHHWLQLQLVGTTAERDAIGATIEVSFGGRAAMAVVTSGDGYMCKNQSLVCLGLGDNDIIDRMIVRWPDGIEQSFEGLSADRRWVVVQSQPDPFPMEL